MNRIADDVREFHAAFGQPLGPPPGGVTAERAALRNALIEEESDELGEAVLAGNLVDIADALADIVYVAYGTALEFGIDLDRAVAYALPYADAYLPISRMMAAVQRLCAATTSRNVPAVAHRLARVARLADLIAARYGIPLDAVLAEVHRSNMSKLDADGQPVYRADGKVMKSDLYSPPDIAGVLERRVTA
ncbi:MAG TPA: hypothetical protein VK453_25180 [Micromonosporaceae bacterium]|nr:hypothetical protein [Micromonosporaceae bacterium]